MLGAGADIEWNAVVNEYGAFFEVHTTTDSGISRVVFGQPIRTHVPRRHRGTGFSTAAIIAGANVVIPMDRDLVADLIVGEDIDIIPMTDDGDSLPGTFIPERVTITMVAASAITVATLANNQPAFCIVGDDPNQFSAFDGNFSDTLHTGPQAS